MSYQPNPKRGCGSKQKGGFYLESRTSKAGTLQPVIYWLGDCLDGGHTIPHKAPPRGVEWVDTWATLTKEIVTPLDENWFPPEGLADRYFEFKSKAKNPGLVDHVGSNNYTPSSFVAEVTEYGPSRRIKQDDAFIIAQVIRFYGTLPIIFTHKSVPLFRDEDEREEAFELVEEFAPRVAAHHAYACWEHDEWGMFHDQYNGGYSSYIGVIEMLDLAERRGWDDVLKFARKIRFVEQPFVSCWITDVSYTLPDDDKINEELLYKIRDFGMNILDLDKDEMVLDGKEVQGASV